MYGVCSEIDPARRPGQGGIEHILSTSQMIESHHACVEWSGDEEMWDSGINRSYFMRFSSSNRTCLYDIRNYYLLMGLTD